MFLHPQALDLGGQGSSTSPTTCELCSLSYIIRTILQMHKPFVRRSHTSHVPNGQPSPFSGRQCPPLPTRTELSGYQPPGRPRTDGTEGTQMTSTLPSLLCLHHPPRTPAKRPAASPSFPPLGKKTCAMGSQLRIQIPVPPKPVCPITSSSGVCFSISRMNANAN